MGSNVWLPGSPATVMYVTATSTTGEVVGEVFQQFAWYCSEHVSCIMLVLCLNLYSGGWSDSIWPN